MARLSIPTTTVTLTSFSLYRPWLLRVFWDHLCAYCLLRDDGVQIDHYEPRALSPDRIDDPCNLLPACDACNGPAGKHDYHPLHVARRRRASDRTGFLVVNVRTDDLGELFSVSRDGAIRPRPGGTRDRASWNIVLLNLDRPTATRRRGQLLRWVEGCELGLSRVASAATNEERASWEELLSRVLPEVAGWYLFLIAFNVPLSSELSSRLGRIAEERRGEE